MSLVPEPYPPGFEVLGGISDRHERGIVLGLLAALYPLASVVRDVALHHGLDEGTAGKVAGDAFHEMVAIVEDEMRAAEVEPFREDRPCWLEPDALWWRPPGEWEFPADGAEGDADGRA